MPRVEYRSKAGDLLLGTTTVIGETLAFKSNALIHWAWKLGCEGKNYRNERDSAAKSGTIAHALIEADIKGEKPDLSKTQCTPEELEAAQRAFASYVDWRDESKLEIDHSEISLVSELFQYGGTLDAVMRRPDGSRILGDFKTSKGVYHDHIIQLAVYRQLWNENHPDDPVRGGAVILRFDKKVGGFKAYPFDEETLDAGWRVFANCLSIYREKARLDAALEAA